MARIPDLSKDEASALFQTSVGRAVDYKGARPGTAKPRSLSPTTAAALYDSSAFPRSRPGSARLRQGGVRIPAPSVLPLDTVATKDDRRPLVPRAPPTPPPRLGPVGSTPTVLRASPLVDDSAPSDVPNEVDVGTVPPRARPVDDPDLAEAIRLALLAKPPDEATPAVAPDDEAVITGMHDVHDVVSFFSVMVGRYTPVKFVFMTLPQQLPGERYNPYALRVVSQSYLNRADYYVLTPSAVAHVQHGAPSEVTTLSDFVRESSIFSILSKIKFFQQYLVFKAFDMWRRNIRLRRFYVIRRKLCQHFFLAKKTFAGPLLEFKRLSHALTTFGLVKLPITREGLQKDQFIKLTREHRDRANEVFRGVVDEVETKLSRLCESVTARANIPDLATPEALNQYIFVLEDEEARAMGQRRVNHKTVSMVALKESMYARMRTLKAAMDDLTLLPLFIRLVDFLSAEALFQNCLSSMQNLFRELARADEEKLLFFITEIYFGADGIQFKPHEEDMRTMFGEVVEELVGAVSSVARTSLSRAFREHFGSLPRVVGMGSALQSDQRIRHIVHETKEVLRNDYSVAVDATRHFDKNRKWFAYVRDWVACRVEWNDRIAVEQSTGNLIQALATGSTALRPIDFSTSFRNIDEAFASLKEMRTLRRGCLVITSTTVVDELTSNLQDILKDVKDRLATVTKDRIDRIFAVYKDPVRVPDAPVTLAKFAAFVARLDEVTAASSALSEIAESIDELFEISEANNCDAVTKDLATRRDMTLGGPNSAGSKREEYEEFLIRGKEYRQQHVDTWIQRLEREIESERVKMEATLSMLALPTCLTYTTDVAEVNDFLSQVETEINATEAQMKTFAQWQRLFGVAPDDFGALNNLKKVFRGKTELWQAVDRWQDAQTQTYSQPLVDVDVAEYEKVVSELYSLTYSKLHPTHKCDASERLLEELKQEKIVMPTVLHLGNKRLKREHWLKILSNQPRAYDPGMTLDSLRQMKMLDLQFREIIAEQSSIATGEAELLRTMDEVKSRWDGLNFDVKNLRDQKDVWILDDVSEVVQAQEEDLLVIQGCLASRFASGIRSRVEEWEKKLALLGQVIEEWVYVQGAWMYLEFIFTSDDIKKQLPAESSLFKSTDSEFRDLMKRTQQFKNCLFVATEGAVLSMLQDARRALDEIQRKIEDYLETKRAAFPRFYFLSNDELLLILSDSRDTRAIRPHLRKCFDSIKDLRFRNDSGTEIDAMISAEGELVPFSTIVFAKGPVEKWLGQVERAMVASLQDHMRSTLAASQEMPRTQWILAVQDSPDVPGFPSQCIQGVDMVQWTAATEIAIDAAPSGLQEHAIAYAQQVLETVAIVRMKLSALQRSLVGTLLVIDVHNRDVLDRLVEQAVADVSDFHWAMQLRYYADRSGSLNIKHVNASFDYAYEYLGSGTRLVITPLTDRAFLTCTSALHMSLGGAPQGPAGTGKTESVKDLGKALARQVVVFNCSDGINYAMMSQMFAGLAQGGAWACFDEFNRIELEVLSVVAQQMLEITTAIAKKESRMIFDGHDIFLHPNFGVFITMNPGYAGRTELPDNLKALFRPICMMIPDYRLIAEIMFFSEGFNNAKSLSTKMVQLYRLSSEQLSKQDHYDFGMRAVKSILVMAGSLKRANPDQDEDMLLIRAMRDSNIPKFLRDDAVLFNALINDLYPGVHLAEESNAALQNAVVASLQEKGLQPLPRFVLKVTQLYETMLVRHGVMTVGQTLTGKTTTYDALQHSLTTLANDRVEGACFSSTFQHVVNPKAISRDELYGSVNATTREWTDGILSKIVRTVVDGSNYSSDRQWIVFDGPVDAVWIENMNTVLDDNKMLCLVNGERLKIPDTVTCCFEVQDLKVASPATVSRCGMVYFELFYLHGGWKPVLQSRCVLLQRRFPALWTPRFVEVLETLFEVGYSILEANALSEWVSSAVTQRVGSVLALLAGLFDTVHVDDDDPAPVVLPPPRVDDDGREIAAEALIIDVESAWDRGKDGLGTIQVDEELMKMFVVFSFIWGFGGNICEKSASRAKFSEAIHSTIRSILPDFPACHSKTVFDFQVRKKSRQWVPWSSSVPQFLFQRHTPFFELLVPTADSVCTSKVITTLLQENTHVLISGVTGTGKSVGVRGTLLDRLNTEDANGTWQSFSLVTSAQTTSRNIQERFESKLRKHPSRNQHLRLGPPQGKKMAAFIDDVNMPLVEEYGASPPIELLRQMLTQGGFYDRKKHLFKEIVNVVMVSCCGPVGGGKNELSQRFTSRFFLLCQPAISTSSMQKIFETILTGYLHFFNEEVKVLAKFAATATLVAFERACTDRRPTPDKSHYTFNLRDVSRVIQGIAQVEPSACLTRDSFVDLWIHEASRVFHDRLTDESDRSWWWKTACSTAESHFGIRVDQERAKAILFGDFASEDRHYARIEIDDRLHDVLNEKMLSFGIQFSREMDLVLFDDAVAHLCRVCRVLRQPRGNMLLVGVGGSGRQSLALLGSFIADVKAFQISITRSYGVENFREDLRKILLEAGCEDKPSSFVISENQLVKEQFLEDINNLLNTGEVANLWQPEDFERILASVRDAVVAAGKPETHNVMMSHFTNLCQNNLHIIVAMSPVGQQFRSRLRMFPSLVNCMTLDWFAVWPETALLSVAHRVLLKVDLESPAMRSAVCKLCVFIHRSVQHAGEDFFQRHRRSTYTTPTSYLSLLHLFIAQLHDQSQQLEDSISRFSTGLKKISSTNETVDAMKKHLTTMQPELEKRNVETTKFAKEVEQEQRSATEFAAIVAREEKECAAIMGEAKAIRDDCQSELDKAMPAYHLAVEALNSLNPKDINEAKAYAAPPKKVEMVLDAVLTVLDEDRGWDNARKLMTKSDFIQTLKNFDKDHVPDRVLRRLKKFIEMEDFRPEAVSNVSKACVSLCLWCRAIDHYCEVLKVVTPKRERLCIAEDKFAVAKQALEQKQAALKKLEEKIRDLQQQYQASMERKQALEQEMQKTQVHLNRAHRLLSGLSDEYERWGKSTVSLGSQRPFSVAKAILSAAMTAYCGPFTSPFRHQLLRSWIDQLRKLEIPMSRESFSLAEVVDPVVIRQWNVKGLPTDEFSVENGCIVKQSLRWCLCIDPQGQANSWIKRTYHDRGLKVIKMTDANFSRAVEGAIRVGNPVLVENVGEELDSSLDPLLHKQVYKQGGRLMIRIRDAAVEYDPNFFFVMTTRLPNPHYLPETQIKVTLVNFTVTFKGLEDQLLAEVVRHEKQELEERADRIVVQVADGKTQLKECEDQILQLLSSAGENILEDEVLINTLAQSKTTSNEIAEALQAAERTSVEIGEARERYRIVATRGSVVYSTVTDICHLEHMYQNSLTFFVKLFNQTLQRTPGAPSIETRCTSLVDAVTINTYNAICRGMFEKDKPVFAFLLGADISRQRGDITAQEWQFFLTGSGGALPRTLVDNPTDYEADKTNSFSDGQWDEMMCLSEVGEGMAFHELRRSFCEETSSWLAFRAGTADEPAALQQMSHFQRLLVIKQLREEQLADTARQFVENQLGKKYVEREPFDLSASFLDSSNTTPIVIILSVGTDPTSMVSAFAEANGFGEKMVRMSLGQGQGARAEGVLHKAQRAGEWVYLQNCHVYASWLPRLEELVADAAAHTPHVDFRLWLTTMPCAAFPVSILQSSVKLTREPPKGLKANFQDTISTALQEDVWSASISFPERWRRMLFSLSLFHAVTQERRRFGPLGWNIQYDWNDGDLHASIKALRTYSEGLDNVPWAAVHYMIGTICYGGRVTDEWDRRSLNVLLRRFVSQTPMATESYHFMDDPHFRMPVDLSDTAVRGMIAALPAQEGPAVFGLHANGDITCQLSFSRQFAHSVVSVQPRSSAGTGSGAGVAETVADLLLRLPTPIDKRLAHPETYRLTESGAMISLGTVCSQEIDRYNALLDHLRNSLQHIAFALRGEVVMDGSMETVVSSMSFFQVPKQWELKSYPSRKTLLSWFADLCNRVEFFRDWNDSGMPASYWIGGFFFPQGFLTSVLQTHSRAFDVAIDKLSFVVHPTKEADSELSVLDLLSTGVYIHGLHMEGARWDLVHDCVSESFPRELFAPMPILALEPVESHTAHSHKDLYECPVYKVTTRAGTLSTTGLSTNFIASIGLAPGSQSPEHWVLRGVALVSMLDD